MQIQSALRVFGLAHHPTLSELNSAFRTLVKRYHPDNNPGNEAWCHDRMVTINTAYDVALRHVALQSGVAQAAVPGQTPSGHSMNQRHAAPHSSQGTTPCTSATSGSAGAFVRACRAQIRAFSLAVEQYYQYGLENIALRTVGSRRLRYNGTLRRLLVILQELTNIAPGPSGGPVPPAVIRLQNLTIAFLENALIGKTVAETPSGIDRLAYRHYRHAADLLDAEMKHRFVPYLAPTTSVPNRLVLAQYELDSLATNYPHSDWVLEAEKKSHLLEALLVWSAARR